MWSDYEAWGRVMDGVLVALAIADIVAFTLEFKGHGWSFKAKVEALGLVLLLLLGLGDWHLHTLATKHDQAQASEISALRERTKELETRTKPRSLNEEQARAFADVLRTNGHGVIQLQLWVGDAEGQAFAEQLEAAVRAGGWTPSTARIMAGEVAPGLYISVHDAHPTRVFRILDAALTAAHLQHDVMIDAAVPEGGAELRTGPRPL